MFFLFLQWVMGKSYFEVLGKIFIEKFFDLAQNSSDDLKSSDE
jgi:hypothetical protein